MENYILDNKHMAIMGQFEKINSNILEFQGGTFPIQQDGNPTPLMGAVLFPLQFSEGIIKAKFIFKEISSLSTCGIIFDYYTSNGSFYFQYAGISNTFGYFIANSTAINYSIGGPNRLVREQEYDMELAVKGTNVSLSVNGVAVSNSTILPALKTNIGVYCQNFSTVQITDFRCIQEKPKAFVVMQFSDEYKAIYEDVIKTVCIRKGLEVIRGDEVCDTGMIISDITRQIEEAAVIIADITPNNANVFYEVGYAHALKKPTILLRDKSTGSLPFDVSGFRTIFYDNKIGGKKNVENALEKFLDNMFR